MPYDEELAYRIRAVLADEPGVDERLMFGGLAFLLNGHLSVAASGQGGLMVRVPPEKTDAIAEHAHAEPMVMGGQMRRGWLRVAPEGLTGDRALRRWVTIGADCARKLPPKD